MEKLQVQETINKLKERRSSMFNLIADEGYLHGMDKDDIIHLFKEYAFAMESDNKDDNMTDAQVDRLEENLMFFAD